MNKFNFAFLSAFIFAYSIVANSDEGFDIDFSKVSQALQNNRKAVVLIIHDLDSDTPYLGSAVFLKFADEAHTEGYFLTAQHVVRPCELKSDCKSMTVVFNGYYTLRPFGSFHVLADGSGKFSTASNLQVEAADAKNDLAIIRVRLPKKNKFEETILAESVAAGDRLYAIGYPGEVLIGKRHQEKKWRGTQKTFSTGRVINPLKTIALPAPVNQTRESLVTNVDVLSGNSGGGLFNEQGQLVGIASTVHPSNKEKYSLSETKWQFGSYAVPLSTIKAMIASLGIK